MTRPRISGARLSLLVLLSVLFGCNTLRAKRRPSDQPQPSDLYYGIYLNDAKVGWMRSQVKVGDRVELLVSLHASVGGMGQLSKVSLSEERAYDARSGHLASLSFSQTAATGKVSISGNVEGDELRLVVEAGNAEQTQAVKVQEKLADAFAVENLARQATVGATAESTRFDPSIQKTVRMTHKVVGVENRMMGGVAVRAVHIETHYPELGITESSWLDSTGKMLESKVGGFFVARLEPPEEARRLDYVEDLLVSSVVKAPERIERPAQVQRMQVRFKGFGENLPPSSERQKVEHSGDEVTLTLQRDKPVPGKRFPVQDTSKEIHANLMATPFIQSDAPAIREAAAKAVGDASDVFTATTRLAAFVFEHVRDEYVPAYSNALEALESRRGDCTEHSILFVALARSLGIPARVAVGIAYWPPGGGFGWHAWAEVQDGDHWYAVDPTWNQAVADATHIKLADGGPAEQARIVMLLGQLRITGLSTE